MKCDYGNLLPLLMLRNSLKCENLFRKHSDSDKISEELQNPNYRVSGAGPYVGMEVLVNIEPEQYMSYTRTYYGVSILVHSPHEYPQTAVAKTIGQIGTDVTIK